MSSIILHNRKDTANISFNLHILSIPIAIFKVKQSRKIKTWSLPTMSVKYLEDVVQPFPYRGALNRDRLRPQAFPYCPTFFFEGLLLVRPPRHVLLIFPSSVSRQRNTVFLFTIPVHCVRLGLYRISHFVCVSVGLLIHDFSFLFTGYCEFIRARNMNGILRNGEYFLKFY